MAYENKEYKAVYGTPNSFKQPRQKMWGVFVVGEIKTAGNKWNLVHMSNDFESAKDFLNDWLRNPDISDNKMAGLDNIIMVEIIPADSLPRV
jgi:hypothetical protein